MSVFLHPSIRTLVRKQLWLSDLPAGNCDFKSNTNKKQIAHPMIYLYIFQSFPCCRRRSTAKCSQALIAVTIAHLTLQLDQILRLPRKKTPIISNIFATVLYSTLLFPTLLYSTLLYSSLLYSPLLSSTLLYSTFLFSTVLSGFSLLFSTLVFSPLLYSALPALYPVLYSILFRSSLHSTLLYSTLPYSTILSDFKTP